VPYSSKDFETPPPPPHSIPPLLTTNLVRFCSKISRNKLPRLPASNTNDQPLPSTPPPPTLTKSFVNAHFPSQTTLYAKVTFTYQAPSYYAPPPPPSNLDHLKLRIISKKRKYPYH